MIFGKVNWQRHICKLFGCFGLFKGLLY